MTIPRHLVPIVLLLGALLLPAAVLSQPPPRLSEEDGGWVLSHLPPVLDHSEIRRHLDTGLTTTFLLRVTARDAAGRPLRGAGRVEVRYELWDEVYRLAALGLDGKLVQHQVGSLEDLQERWQELRLKVLTASGQGGPSPEARVRVDLEVIPFSRSEQQDTRRWFSESVERSGRGNAENAGQVSEERSETLGEVFNLLMATSIKRRAVFGFEWQIPLSRPADPDRRRRSPP